MCQDGDKRDDDLSSEAADPSAGTQDRVPARVSNRDASRSTFAAVSTTARRTRAHTRGQGPPETMPVAQVAPTVANNPSVGHLQPYSGRPQKRSRGLPCASEVEEEGGGTAGIDEAEGEGINNTVEGTTTGGGASAGGEGGNPNRYAYFFIACSFCFYQPHSSPSLDSGGHPLQETR